MGNFSANCLLCTNIYFHLDLVRPGNLIHVKGWYRCGELYCKNTFCEQIFQHAFKPRFSMINSWIYLECHNSYPISDKRDSNKVIKDYL